MATRTVDGEGGGGFGEELDLIAQQLGDAQRYLPTEAPNDVEAPDLLNFNEVANNTDRTLADTWFRRFRHLFTNGDGHLYIYDQKLGSWSKDNVPTKILAYCVQLADPHYAELAAVRELREAALRAGREDEAATLGQRVTGITNLIKHCEKSSTIGNVAKLVQAKLVTLLAYPNRMNNDDYVIACSNGVVDLRDGSVRWPRPEDRITRNTQNIYKHDVDFTWWSEVVSMITSHNPRLQEFLQVWAGYCATGLTREHAMAFWHGKGRNGKNLLMDAVAAALGGYAQSLPSSFLEFTGKDNGSSDNNLVYALAQLDGCRYAYISETGDRGRMRESMVKSQTGDKTMRARLARENFYEFTVTHKLTVASNHKPSISGTDDGIWSRMRLVPFNTIFGSQEAIDAGIAQYLQDRSLLERVRSVEGRESVLAWVVDGARKYLAHGLARYLPAEVAASTQVYRREQDVLGQFLQDVTVHIPLHEVERVQALEGGGANVRAFGKLNMHERMRVEKQELWRIYVLWCEEHGHHAMSSTMFSRRITDAQRFWVDEVGAELLMKPLDVVKTGAAYQYRYLRLSDLGVRLQTDARARAEAGKSRAPRGDEPPF